MKTVKVNMFKEGKVIKTVKVDIPQGIDKITISAPMNGVAVDLKNSEFNDGQVTEKEKLNAWIYIQESNTKVLKRGSVCSVIDGCFIGEDGKCYPTKDEINSIYDVQDLQNYLDRSYAIHGKSAIEGSVVKNIKFFVYGE